MVESKRRRVGIVKRPRADRRRLGYPGSSPRHRRGQFRYSPEGDQSTSLASGLVLVLAVLGIGEGSPDRPRGGLVQLPHLRPRAQTASSVHDHNVVHDLAEEARLGPPPPVAGCQPGRAARPSLSRPPSLSAEAFGLGCSHRPTGGRARLAGGAGTVKPSES